MRLQSGLALILLTIQSGVAFADSVSDCRRSWDAVISARGCTEIINGGSYAPDQKAEAYRRRGVARSAAGALDEAIGDFNDAIKLRPDDAAAFAARGEARLSRRDNSGAIVDFTAAIEINPRSADYFVARGHAHMVDAHPDAAIADFDTALILDPKNVSALNNRGLAFRKKGDLDRAIADYNAAIAINPLYALAFNNRGYAYEARGRKTEAIADFRQAILIDPSLFGAKEGLRRLGVTGDLGMAGEAFAEKGKLLAQKNCSWCHAIGNTGDSSNPKAPPFRNIQSRHPLLALRIPLSRGIAAVHEQMPRFKLTDQEIDEIVAYINGLKTSN